MYDLDCRRPGAISRRRDRGMALEESQSLLLEMLVVAARLRAVSAAAAGEALCVSGPEWEPENLYRRLTQVKRSLIRVDADELTYPLHILLRYELEKKLLSGELAVRDVPMLEPGLEQRLEVRPTGADGCLQDIHWRSGLSAIFRPTRSRRDRSAALESLREAVPELESQIARGEFGGCSAGSGKCARHGRQGHRE